jgi:hypothetical protein
MTKITYRAVDRLEMAFMQEGPELDVAANDPRHTCPMEMRKTPYKVDRGAQDVPVLYRGDTIPLEATLLDVRGNAFPDLASAVSIKLAVKKLVPLQELLYVLDGTLIDAALGRVDFLFDAVSTDMPDVDEAILSVRVEKAAGEYVTFETDMVHFRDSAFTASP